MKKINESLSKEYLPLLICRDDLEDIASHLGAAQNVKYESEGFEYDSITELVKNSRSEFPKSISIKTNNPYTTIELDYWRATLYVDSRDLTAIGLFHQLDTILTRCRRFGSWFYSYYFIWLLNLIIWFTPGTILRGYSEVKTSIETILIGWISFVVYIRLRKQCLISLVSRRENKNFWLRNKDQLVVAILATIVGAILGVVGTHLVSHFK